MDQTISQPIEKSVRREYRHMAGKFKTGKLPPIMAVPFLGGESGLLEQTVTFELAPIAGRMLSDIYAEVTAIAVPIQAIDKLLNGETDENAGITEILRRKVMDGETIFGTENEGELTKRMGIFPRSVSGSKKVSAVARLAYNAAVNHKRKVRYVYTVELPASNAAVSNAIISETTLDRFNAALDPDEHINGNVQLDFSNNKALVRGIQQSSNIGAVIPDISMSADSNAILIGGAGLNISLDRVPSASPDQSALNIYADLTDVKAEGISLTDLYNAQAADKLVRKMRQIVKDHPQDGEDAVLRWVFGLKVDAGQKPFLLYNKRQSLVDMRRNAMDAQGMQDEVSMTYMINQFDFAVPVPMTEIGCVVITLAQVTPDEIVDAQPHPIFSKDWAVANQVAAQMKLDPELITLRDMYSDVTPAGSETTPVFYVGHNQLLRNYVNYGFNRHVDPETVENKTVMWQYAIPAGVTPDSILYPDNLPQYPFMDQLAEVVTYDIVSKATISTPAFFGPSPVETVSIIKDNNIFGDE